MTSAGFTLFDTAIGRCGIAWNGRGITAVQLPERSDERTRGRMTRRAPGAVEAVPPAAVAEVIEGLVRLLDTGRGDLSAVALDLDGLPAFDRDVYAVARTIPAGATLSYGTVAERAGAPGEAREVGQALGRNPFPLVVPCHRVVNSDGQLGGFSANGGTATKRALLSIEGAAVAPPTLF